MSRPGALSKKELAEAGRRKLEEFKKKKQQKSTEPGAGPNDAAIGSSPPEEFAAQAPASAAHSATSATQPSVAAKPATSPVPPSASSPYSAAAAPSAAPEPAPWVPSLSTSSDASSTAARAAAAGAAAAALEAALMGLPSATPPAMVTTVPKAAVAPAAAAASTPKPMQQQPWTPASPVFAVPAKQLSPQPVQAAFTGSPSKGSTSPGAATQQPHQQWPSSVPQQPAEVQDSASAVSVPWQQDSRQTSKPTADLSAVAADAGGGGQRGGWLSLFGNRGPSQQGQHMQQQPAGQQQLGAYTQQQPQQHPGQFDSLLLYHHPSHTRQPSSPGQRASPLIPQAAAAIPGAVGTGKLPAPWVPGTAATAAANQMSATAGLPKQPWMPGMPLQPQQQPPAASGDSQVRVAAASSAAADHAGLSDRYLGASAPAAAGVVAAASMQDTSSSQQRQSPGQAGAAAGQQPQAAAAGYASLSDSYLGQPTKQGPDGGSISSSPLQQQQQQAPSMRPPDASQSMHSPPAAAGLVSEISFSPRSAAAAAASKAQQAAGMAGHGSAVSPEPASGLSAVLQPQDKHQQQKHLLPNGALTQPDSHSSFASLGAGNALANGIADKPHAAAVGVPAGGSAAGSAGPGTAPAGSLATNSVAGSGPPSTSGGFSAMSYIQAHAETSSRNTANLKLLQQHIDELTTEKLELMRGLQQQVKANEALAEENRTLTEQQNSMAAKVESERQQVKQLGKEMEAAAASLAALVGQRDALRAAAQEATDRANTLAAENVALENQLLELKSSSLRLEREAKDAVTAVSKLEAQLAQLASSAGQQGQELQGLQTERRILKARLMQAESRMRSAGAEPLPPMPAGMTAADAEAAPAVTTADAEVQTEPQQHPRYQLPPDTTALDFTVLQPTAAAVKVANRKLLDPVVMTEQAAAILSGLEQWLPGELLAAAEAAIAAGHAARQQQHMGNGDSAAAAPDDHQSEAAFNATMSAAADVLTGGVCGDVWAEEARLASSVAGLAEQLEGSWDGMLQELQQVQFRNEELRQQSEELQEQLADLQQKYEQQQQHLLQRLAAQQRQEQPQQQEFLQQQHQQSTSNSNAPHESPAQAGSQQGAELYQQQLRQQQQQQDFDLHQQRQQHASLHHHQQLEPQQQQHVPAHLPVSVPAASGATEITAPELMLLKAYNNHLHSIPDASSPATAVVRSRESPVTSAASVVGSTTGSIQPWDDGSTASSRPGGKGWFAAWGRRSNSQRSPLV